MTTLSVATKHCGMCLKVKPLSEFYRDIGKRDGRSSRCKPCQLAKTREWQAAKREEMGHKAYREYRRAIVAKSRNRTGNKSARLSASAYSTALYALRDLHRDQFESLLRQERYDRGLDV
jgi:hypothetical protein